MNRSMNRRQFLRSIGACAAGAAAVAWLPGARAVRGAPAAKPPRPNIILIMADDMGFSDVGCYGGEINTPNIDGLAARGLRFTQFYNTARCCPTRASLLTGLYPHQAGIGHMVEGKGIPAYQGYLNDRCVTIAEALRPAGYRTMMVGKWHVGEKRPNWPCDRGFDSYYGLVSGASNFWRLDPGRVMARDNEPVQPEGDRFYMTDAFTDNALRMLDDAAKDDRPFFMYVAYTSPHWPLHAWPEDIEKYKGKYMTGWDALRASRHKRMIEMGLVDARWPLTPRDTRAPAWEDAADKEARDLKMAVYAAQIDRMDQNIGRLLAKLRAIGREENTLVLFLADNGGCAEEINRGKPGVPPGPADSYLSYGLPWANASNTPFRLYKHWVHEGGIATPLVACWPARIKTGGRLTPEPGHLVDLMATCCDVAGAEYPGEFNGKPVQPCEGRSLVPAFDGAARPIVPIYWEHEGNRAVRLGKWKIVSRHPAQWELYDMEADRTEMNNLAGEFPDRVREMAALYDAWAARAGVVPWETFNKGNKAGKAKQK